MSTISTMLVDPRPVVLFGLHRAMEAAGDFLVVGEERDASVAPERVLALRPMEVVLGLPAGDASRLEALSPLCEACRGALLVLVGQPGRGLLAMASGARGVCMADTELAAILGAARAVAGGENWYDAPIMARLRTELRERDRRRERERDLTDRERQVLALIGQGKGYHEIAAALDRSGHTAKVHAQHVMEKLGIHDRAQLSRYGSDSAERSRVLDACLAVLGAGITRRMDARSVGKGE